MTGNAALQHIVALPAILQLHNQSDCGFLLGMMRLAKAVAPSAFDYAFVTLWVGAELLRYDLRARASSTAAAVIHCLQAPGDAFAALAVPEVGACKRSI